MRRTHGPNGGAPASLDFEGVEGVDAYATSLQQLTAEARNQLALMTVDLDRRLYGTEAFVQRLRAFILQHRRAKLRVLVNSPAVAVRNSPRLVEFGRLLSSRIEFRELLPERWQKREEYFICDETSLLFRSAPEQLQAKLYLQAPMVARQQLRAFDNLWEESPPARDFSSLGI
jgi:hypothetical protein